MTKNIKKIIGLILLSIFFTILLYGVWIGGGIYAVLVIGATIGMIVLGVTGLYLVDDGED